MMNFEVELSGLSETQHSEFRIQNSLLVFPVSSTGYQAPRAGGRAYVRLRGFRFQCSGSRQDTKDLRVRVGVRVRNRITIPQHFPYSYTYSYT